MEPEDRAEDAEDNLSTLNGIRTSTSATGSNHHKTIGSYFAHAMEAQPGRAGSIDPNPTALLWLRESLSFDWLQRTSGALADVLQSEAKIVAALVGNKSQDTGTPLIGLCLQPSPSAVATLLAILKIGYAYVPFDESYPRTRVKAMVEGCGLRLLLTDAVCGEPTRLVFEELGVKVLLVEDLLAVLGKLPCNQDSVCLLPTFGTDALAAVLYTSGSSGTPKGVCITHRNILNRIRWQWTKFPFIDREVCCWKTSLTFVDSIAEIFAPLLAGVPLAILPKAVAANPQTLILAIHEHRITRLVLVPSLLRALLDTLCCLPGVADPSRLKSVHLWVSSGELLSAALAVDFFKALGTCAPVLANFYGSTEIMGDVSCSTFNCLRDVEEKQANGALPISDAGSTSIVDNTAVYIADPDTRRRVRKGDVGEIWVAGRNVTAGYLGLSGDLASKFRPNPFPPPSPEAEGYEVVFCTGDYGAIVEAPDAPARLYCKGRIDSQVKVRGQRVSLVEIDATIQSRMAHVIAKAWVLCHRPGAPDQALVAFIIPKDPEYKRTAFLQELRAHLRPCDQPEVCLLPGPEFPLLVNGKVDRQRLLAEYEKELDQRRRTREREECEQKRTIESIECDPVKMKGSLEATSILVAVISEVTGTPCKDIVENLHSSFYILGGNSLNSVAVVVRLWQFGLHIEIGDFISASSLQSIVDLLKPVPITPTKSRLGGVRQGQVHQLTTSAPFQCHPVQAEHRKVVTSVLAKCFADKGDLEQYTGASYEDYEQYIDSIWDSAILNNDLCFVCLRAADHLVVGASLNFDYADFCRLSPVQSSPGIARVFEIIHYIENAVSCKLPPNFRVGNAGQLVRSSLAGTDSSLDQARNVHVMELMSKHLTKLAVNGGFEAVLSINTSSLTQQIDRDVQGFETLMEYQINRYTPEDGSLPYAAAPDTQIVICSLMRLSKIS